MLCYVNEGPSVIFLTGHHLTDRELDGSHMPIYKLCESYSSMKSKQLGGGCLLILENPNFSIINLQSTCNSAIITGNIFITNRRSYSIKPCLKGLSAHDAEFTTFKNFLYLIKHLRPGCALFGLIQYLHTTPDSSTTELT
jgi:hypothetical protein